MGHHRLRRAVREARRRLTGRLHPIIQTAAAAAVAWHAAVLLLPDERPAFAAIAAVISVGAVHGRRGERAVQLALGVVVGITVADLVIGLIGAGGAQIGLMVVIAMVAAVLIGEGELLVVEAAVSAILLVALDPSGAEAGFSLNRMAEAVIGGAAALAISAVLFPPDPALAVERATQAMFGDLGRALERIAAALERRDAEAAQAALGEARAIDALIAAAHASLAVGRETARLAPPRRAALSELDRYARTLAQLDFAVRNTRMLARSAVRLTRDGAVPAGLPDAVGDLARAVWELAAAYDREGREQEARRLAVRAAGRATAIHEARPGLALTELVVQVRSTAVDLIRAADLLAEGHEPIDERPTEELLAVPALAV